MKQKVIIAMILLVILVMIYFIFTPLIFFEMWNVETGHHTIIESVFKEYANGIDTAINKKKYNTFLDEYIKERFGSIVSNKFIILENGGSYYKIKFNEVMEKSFSVGYNKEKKICGDTFSEVLSTDPKFQHLYSEWVKKQVGIDDEDMELSFNGVYDTPYIEFDKIISLSDDYREVFENTHNYKLENILIKNIKELDYNFFIGYSEEFVYKNYKRLIINTPYLNTKDFAVSLFAYDFDMHKPNYLEYDKYYNCSSEEPNNYTCRVLNGVIQDIVYYSYRDSNNKTVVADILSKK